MITFLLLSGCGTNNAVFEGYESAKARAVAVPGAAPAQWQPDLRIELSPPLVNRMVEYGLERNGSFEADVSFGVGRAHPKLRIDHVDIAPSKKCDSCFQVDVDLSGELPWVAGVLGKGNVPATASARLDVELSTQKVGEDWLVKGLPRDVRDVKLTVPGWSASVKRAASPPIERWLNEQVEQIEPITLTTFAGEDLPLRAVQLKPRGRGLAIHGLSTASTPGTVVIDKGQLPSEGYAVWVGFDTLVSFAAKAAFEEGPQDYEVVAVPTSLTSKKRGFTLGLRLWGLGGGGWWRDYTAHGGISVQKGQVHLEAQNVKQRKTSPGALAADPLVFLAEGIVLDAIKDAMKVSLPNFYSARVGSKASVTLVHSIRGDAGGLRVSGDVTLTRAKGVGSVRKP